jgi:predicted nuclease of predicted toxin-antitoxin system
LARFVVDEDLPRSTADELRKAGHEAIDVRDAGLRGHSDDDVFVFAQNRSAAIVTADKDFTDIRRFPLSTHHGIVVLRLPNSLPIPSMNAALLSALAGFGDDELEGSLLIVELTRIRLRRQRPGAEPLR